jgi:hypothetical protein
MVWQSPLPNEASSSIDSFLFGQETLYLNDYRGRVEISLGTGQVKYHADAESDYAITLLEEHGDILIGLAERTRGSTKYALWGLKGAAERTWSYEMQTDSPREIGSSSGNWAYRSTPNGIILIQAFEDDDDILSTVLLDPQTGQVIQQSETAIDDASLESVLWDDHTAYLMTWRHVYTLDLETLSVMVVAWP